MVLELELVTMAIRHVDGALSTSLRWSGTLYSFVSVITLESLASYL